MTADAPRNHSESVGSQTAHDRYITCVNGNRVAATQEMTTPADSSALLAEIQKNSLSHVVVSTPAGQIEVYLYAQDQKASIVASPYCAANQGDQEFEGHYQLISAKGNAIISRLDVLPEGTFFVAERPPHDGLHLFKANGHRLAVLYRYAGCNIEMFHAYRVSQMGKLAAVDFLARDGQRFSAEATGPDGRVETLPEGRDLFCWYNNAIGHGLCDVYRYDGRNFMQLDAWMLLPGMPVNSRGITSIQRAARALYDFLVALDNKKYQAAVYYFTGAGRPETASQERTATYLRDYCDSPGAHCWTPFAISGDKAAAAGATMAFDVLLVDMSSESNQEFHATFRVRRRGNRYKVLNLPLQAPQKN